MPLGTLPVTTMVFLGVFVAYVCILGVSLLSQSLGITIIAIMFFEMGTSAYLWVIVLLDSVSRHVNGLVPVWNTAAIGTVTIQTFVAVAAIVATLIIQNRKRDFI